MISSNIGSKPISLSNSLFVLKIQYKNKHYFYIRGRLGNLIIPVSNIFQLQFDKIKKNLFVNVLPSFYKLNNIVALWGTYRTHLSNMIYGVSRGFSQNVELVGLGYRASLQESTLKLKIGASHDVSYVLPKGMSVKFLSPTLLSLRGIDSQKIHHVAMQLYMLRKPDPYKGKGVRIPEKIWIKKEGKKQK